MHCAPPSPKNHYPLFFALSVTFLLGIILSPGAATAQDKGFSINSLPPASPRSLTPKQLQRGKEILQQKQGETSSPFAQPLAPTGRNEEKKSAEIRPDSTQAEEKAETAEGGPSSPERGLSPFESYIQGKKTQAISLNIRQFGYDLFENPPTTFAPADMVPVGPDYLLGPGDELRMNIWGKLNANHIFFLDRDGKVDLPQVGTIHLAGLTFSEAKEFIREEFGRYYKPTEVKINISMGQLRSIRVFIVGKAERPGSYTLSSFSTLINALFSAGGPSKIGTMRDIQVKRKGKTITHFDLYDFLLKGGKENDIRLMPEDVIFIPTVGPRVGLAGNVKAPAIYELKGETGLQDLIGLAGGINATGYLQQVQMERVFENQAKKILDIDFRQLEEGGKIPLKDGDIVKVFSINQSVTNQVDLIGNLVRPGTYQWKPGIRIKDLIHSTDDFLPDTFLDFALVERMVPPDYHKEYLSIGLGKLLLDGDESENILLSPFDTIVVFNRWDLLTKENVHISGAVNKPGRFEHRPNMKLSDLLKLAGGLKRSEHPDSYLGEGIITRRMPPDFHEEKLSFDFRRAVIEQDAEADLFLSPMDRVQIFDIWELAQEKKVHIVGAVNSPGSFAWAEKMRVIDLVNLAEGVKYFASLELAELTRIAPTSEGPKVERFEINLERAIGGDPEHNITLQTDDHFSVQTIPEWELYRTVHIGGEVRFPGTYTSKKGEALSALIARAGGFTERAYLKGAFFTRESVRQLQQRQLDEAIDRLEHQLLSQSANTIEAALSPDVLLQEKAATGQRQALIAKMRAAKAKGRIAIHLETLENFKGSPSDLILEEGDRLAIPEKPQQIQVIGSVYNQTAFIFDVEEDVSDYLKKAGGMTEHAEEDALYILKIDGSAISRRQGESWWGGGIMSSSLDPGDTIVVPEKLERISWLREVKELTQILFQIATTAGILIVAL
ncbi:MAG: SLBB domain-containing protein [Nitrospira sp.]